MGAAFPRASRVLSLPPITADEGEVPHRRVGIFQMQDSLLSCILQGESSTEVLLLGSRLFSS